MKTTHAPDEIAKTSSLTWTMRLGGILVSLFSTFLLVKNLGFGVGDDIFCAASLGLGLVTFAVSWVPMHEVDSL